MKLTLTESAKKFINTLDETDQAKLIFTEDAVESDDEGISAKLGLYIKARLTDIGNDIRVTTERFRAEHPEYFE